MNDIKHTPGPWSRIGFTVGVETGSAFDEVARINPDMPDASGNVRLVEAAPDMLAALEGLLESVFIRRNVIEIPQAWQAAFNAIQRAKGAMQ